MKYRFLFFSLMGLCLAEPLFCMESPVVDTNGSRSSFDASNGILSKLNLPGVTTWRASKYKVSPGQEYEAALEFSCEELIPGAAASLQLVSLDASGREIGRIADPARFQQVYAENLPQKLKLRVKAGTETAFIQPELKLGGNPLKVRIGRMTFGKYVPKPLFKGIYGERDPMPPRVFALKDMAKLKASESWIAREAGRPVLYINGKKNAYKAYKGGTDYRLMCENGANIIVTHGGGGALYWGKEWDKQAYAGNGKFDFKRLEDNLLRIYAANPDAKVIVTVECDPDNAWLEAHPENIYLNEKGERGVARYTGFKGFGSSINQKKQERWAWTYASEAYQRHVIQGLKAMAEFLKQSPAGNIVIGFCLAGGHDGQYVQWRYGDETAGHADYSESFQAALRKWLKEKYGTDEALRRAWNDPEITLDTARVFTGKEWRSKPYFDTEPGIDRKITDCRTFLSVSTARMLRKFGNVLKESFGRRCVIQTWYSSPVWRQTSRLAAEELAKGGIDIVAQVTDYAPPRLARAPGGSANYTIADSNLHNLLYVQEMDHRTWRTQEVGGWNYTAYPSGPAEFRSQVIRDAGSVLAAGGSGFYYYDMFGSWYHDPEALKIIRETYRMADWAEQKRNQVPRTEFAVFMDERDRLHGEGIANGGSAMKSLRMSGLTPDIYMLDDILNPELPEYKLYLFFSPMTITREQLNAILEKAYRKDAVVMIAGPAGVCGPFRSAEPVLKAFGLQIQDSMKPFNNVVAFDETVKDPLTERCTGRLGTLGVTIRKDDVAWLRNPFGAKITDAAAIVLGRWLGTSEPGLVVKRSEGRTLIYTPQIAGVSAQLINNAAKEAGILPPSEAGNAVYVGNGIAAGHRLADPIVIRFREDMNFYDPATGEKSGSGREIRLDCKPGESRAVLYERAVSQKK